MTETSEQELRNAAEEELAAVAIPGSRVRWRSEVESDE